MIKKLLTYIFLYSTIVIQVNAQQTCTTVGQNPSTAFPVCGTSVFNQSTVPICGDRPLSAPGCSGVQLSDKNPYWYKFTCFTGGTLGFLITPLDLNEDYD
ncbi:MAG TPA: hypothetical protein VK484_01215, partial [Ferruginibacter sp.]|nr:hypothetical protein [Ferruginibacter sp.]